MKARTVLLVDDDPHARRAMYEILQHDGYRVLEGGTADQALTVASHHPDPIDVLLTDVVMPEMSGRDLAARLKELRPAIKIVYVSGYSADHVSNYGVLQTGSLLQKPFKPEALLDKIRAVLEPDRVDAVR